jgi:methylenetetrahydrofolate dehydrogenase (NADP+)/methenyltetrahydrofolate cyclohydrolase
MTNDAGMKSFEHRLPAETSQKELLTLIEGLNSDSEVHGILVQLPLPDQINEQAVLAKIDPAKDVDGFHIFNAGKLATGSDGLVPCTPLGCIMMIKDQLGDDLSGKQALVIGRSNIVGKPMAALLLKENCTVTIAHSRTADLPAEARRADILVAAVGRAQMVKGDWVKEGAVVIDVGMNRLTPDGDGKSKLCGDVDFEEAVKVAGAITPVPGGVGPMTIACLLQNTVTAACAQNDIEVPEV